MPTGKPPWTVTPRSKPISFIAICPRVVEHGQHAAVALALGAYLERSHEDGVGGVRAIGRKAAAGGQCDVGGDDVDLLSAERAVVAVAIDGEDNPIGNISTTKFFEVQEYLSIASRVYTTYTLTASKKTWDRLNPEEQALIVACADEAKVSERKVARDLNCRLLADLKKAMQVNEVSLAERARFADKGKPVYEEYAKVIGEDFVQQWLAGLDSIRAGK